MKLNPSKCTFVVLSSKFLGCMVTQRRIEANSTQMKALKEMPSPISIEEVQRLIERIAA